jgi:hypothetical protein
MIVIKNLKPKYLQSFKKKGTVLISSFNRCREYEWIGKDETEGIKGVDIKTHEPLQIKGDDLGKFISYVKVQGQGSINIGGSLTIKNANLLPDTYIFCTSLILNNTFGRSHYNILDIQQFGGILFDSIREIDNEVYDWAHGQVVYGGAKNPITTVKQLVLIP